MACTSVSTSRAALAASVPQRKAQNGACARTLAPLRKQSAQTQTKCLRRAPTVCVMSPERSSVGPSPKGPKWETATLGETISHTTIQELEKELDVGESVKALRRFNDALENISEEKWETRMWRVWNELAYNLESFNPVFTACLLKVQCTLGYSDYVRRDESLRNLIQPLAGEYGMHNGEPMGKTHRKLFSEFYHSCTGLSLESLLAQGVKPTASEHLFAAMMRDITSGGGRGEDGIEQASYALGYNLAVEYLAAYEKTWLLDTFKVLDSRFLQKQGREVEWMFLEVHAVGEPEHADIGHNAVAEFVPQTHKDTLRAAMQAHDRDFAEFYNALTDMLES